MAQKFSTNHNSKLTNERSTAGLRIIACLHAAMDLDRLNIPLNIAIAIGAQAEKKWYKHNPDVS